jgi:anthranilate phosphoribosyltransferase
MDGNASDAQIGSFITALRMKGESIEEITAAAQVMREKATKVLPRNREHLVDTCGTGGDAADTFNISTATALVSAAAGARVAKHGNRSVSSKSGSADVLEELGIDIGLTPAQMRSCLDEIGICFLFAPALHKAMKYAIGPRKEIGIRTIFNILGPLTNPALAPSQVLGVFSPDLTEPIAHALGKMGVEKAYVVHGDDGMDEVTLCAATTVAEVSDGTVTCYKITPENFGLSRCEPAELAGGTPRENAHIIERVLEGATGAARDIVVLNSGFALAASRVAASVTEGVAGAYEAIDSGAAADILARLKAQTHR